MCPSDSAPGGLTPAQTPQFVLVRRCAPAPAALCVLTALLSECDTLSLCEWMGLPHSTLNRSDPAQQCTVQRVLELHA